MDPSFNGFNDHKRAKSNPYLTQGALCAQIVRVAESGDEACQRSLLSQSVHAEILKEHFDSLHELVAAYHDRDYPIAEEVISAHRTIFSIAKIISHAAHPENYEHRKGTGLASSSEWLEERDAASIDPTAPDRAMDLAVRGVQPWLATICADGEEELLEEVCQLACEWCANSTRKEVGRFCQTLLRLWSERTGFSEFQDVITQLKMEYGCWLLNTLGHSEGIAFIMNALDEFEAHTDTFSTENWQVMCRDLHRLLDSGSLVLGRILFERIDAFLGQREGGFAGIDESSGVGTVASPSIRTTGIRLNRLRAQVLMGDWTEAQILSVYLEKGSANGGENASCREEILALRARTLFARGEFDQALQIGDAPSIFYEEPVDLVRLDREARQALYLADEIAEWLSRGAGLLLELAQHKETQSNRLQRVDTFLVEVTRASSAPNAIRAYAQSARNANGSPFRRLQVFVESCVEHTQAALESVYEKVSVLDDPAARQPLRISLAEKILLYATRFGHQETEAIEDSANVLRVRKPACEGLITLLPQQRFKYLAQLSHNAFTRMELNGDDSWYSARASSGIVDKILASSDRSANRARFLTELRTLPLTRVPRCAFEEGLDVVENAMSYALLNEPQVAGMLLEAVPYRKMERRQRQYLKLCVAFVKSYLEFHSGNTTEAAFLFRDAMQDAVSKQIFINGTLAIGAVLCMRCVGRNDNLLGTSAPIIAPLIAYGRSLQIFRAPEISTLFKSEFTRILLDVALHEVLSSKGLSNDVNAAIRPIPLQRVAPALQFQKLLVEAERARRNNALEEATRRFERGMALYERNAGWLDTPPHAALLLYRYGKVWQSLRTQELSPKKRTDILSLLARVRQVERPEADGSPLMLAVAQSTDEAITSKIFKEVCLMEALHCFEMSYFGMRQNGMEFSYAKEWHIDALQEIISTVTKMSKPYAAEHLARLRTQRAKLIECCLDGM